MNNDERTDFIGSVLTNLDTAREYVKKLFNYKKDENKKYGGCDPDDEIFTDVDFSQYELTYEDVVNILIVCLGDDMSVEVSHEVADLVILRFMQITMCDDNKYTKEQSDRICTMYLSLFKYYS